MRELYVPEMLNTEINEFASQSNLTQVASYFDIVDNSVKTGDTNKRYTYSTNACNAPAAPIKAGGWTSVVISPQGDNMCDLYNSFVKATMTFSYKLDSSCSCGISDVPGPLVWIGFKDAMDAIEQYQLVANGQSFYTQSNAIEESYITSLATTESVKKTDVFSKVRHKDLWKGKANAKLGDFIDTTKGTSGTVTIDLKIDLRRILPLSGIKLLPGFVGNMELRIKFGTAGLVCAPVGYEYALAYRYDLLSKLGAKVQYTNHFVPVGVPFSMPTSITNSSGTITISTASRTVTVSDAIVDTCYSYLACFGLDDNLYQALITRYSQDALSYPIQTLSFQTMNGLPNKDGCDLTLTATPRFVDSIYILLQRNQLYRTCYENPLFANFVLKMGGYGTIPDVQFDSSSAEFYEMASNAYNTNNDLTGFNEDVMKSIVNEENVLTGTVSNDVTNFVMAFPASTDFTYQQGQTSNTPITYQLRATFSKNSGGGVPSPFANDTSCIPVMGFLKDSVLAIQLRPVGPPIIALDEYDLSSPAGA